MALLDLLLVYKVYSLGNRFLLTGISTVLVASIIPSKKIVFISLYSWQHQVKNLQEWLSMNNGVAVKACFFLTEVCDITAVFCGRLGKKRSFSSLQLLNDYIWIGLC